MREIKFRAWDGDKMIYGVDISNNGCVLSSGYEYPSWPIMQFTCLKDKSGVEIYKGDIVRCGYGFGEVIFYKGCFMVQWIDDKEADMEFVFSRNGRRIRENEDIFLIIGNIYENPDLLK